MKVNYKGKELNVNGRWMLEYLVSRTGRPYEIICSNYGHRADVFFLDDCLIVEVYFNSSDDTVLVHDCILTRSFRLNLTDLIETLTLTEEEYLKQFEGIFKED